MGNLANKDKHNPAMQTDRSTTEQPKPTLDPPQKPQWQKDLEKEPAHQKTGTR